MHAPETGSLVDVDSLRRTEVAEGGFAGDTEVMTTRGPVPMADLTPADTVLALNPTKKLVKPKPVVQVETVTDVDEVVTIETRRCDLRLAPGHRFCYTTKSIEYPRFTAAADLPQLFQRRFLNDWQPRSGTRLDAVDITDFVGEYEMCASTDERYASIKPALPNGCAPQRYNSLNGCYFDPETFKAHQAEIETVADDVTIHSGHNSRFRPYRFDGDDFIELLGWFVTEGCVHWADESNTAVVQISQQDRRYRPKIAGLFERLGITVSVDEAGFSFGSKVFATVLQWFCGKDSYTKRLPSFTWDPEYRPETVASRDTLARGWERVHAVLHRER